MFQRLFKLFGASSAVTSTASAPTLPAPKKRNLASSRAFVDSAIDPGHQVLDREREKIVWADVPHYPAYDQGFPVVPADKLVQTYDETVRRVMGLSNFDGEVSRNAIHRILHNYAEYVHALPASYQQHYYGAGGLLKLGLDVGFHALQGSNGVVFTKESADIRSRAEPRWKLATFVAGIACEVYRTISSMRVTNQNGEEWNPLLQSLTDWLETTHATRYWVIWIKNDEFNSSRSVVSAIIPHLVDADILQYISKERQALFMMFSSITSGVRPSDPNPIALLVERKRFELVKRDVERNPNKIGQPQIGHHIDPAIIDAMRSLIKTQAWLVNQKGGRAWLTHEGLFVAWKQGGPELLKKLSQNEIPGIPNDVETIREIMQAHGIIDKNPNGKIYWQIVPEGTKANVDAVKISKPLLLIPDVDAILSEFKFQVLKENLDKVQPQDPATTSPPVSKPEPKVQEADSVSKPAKPKKNPPKITPAEKPAEAPLQKVTSSKGDIEEEGAAPSLLTESGEFDFSPDSLSPHFDGSVPPLDIDIPFFSDVSIADVESESSKVEPREFALIHENQSDDSVLDSEREARELSRLPKPVADLFRSLIQDFKSNKIKLTALSDSGVGIPFEVFQAPKSNVSFLAVMTSLSKISALYTPPGQTTKITTVEIKGENVKFIGVTRFFAASVFGWKGD